MRLTQSTAQAYGFSPLGSDEGWMQHTDVWPAGKFRQTARMAYDQLTRRGDIRPLAVARNPDGAITVRYLSQIPQAWTRDALRDAERIIRGE